ncbi:MAG: T9SS type A sorting domain-containing protein [Flavobacteriales bacterium]|nr:T9SS type A sorting domain-containing protein [Flavobacteriales bacterium]
MRTFFLFVLTISAISELNAQFYPAVPLTNTFSASYNLDAGYGDVDADGHVDIVDFAYNKLWVMYTEPDGSYSEVGYDSGLEQMDFVEAKVLDFDGDGDMDVATGSGWLENQNGVFQGEHYFTSNHYKSQYAIFKDVNADNLPDVLLPSNQIWPSPYNVVVILNDGTGEFLSENLSVLDDNEIYQAVLEDFDNDGDSDLFGYQGGNIYVYLNDGTGHFSSGNLIVTDSYWVYFIKDLNGDGYADLFSPQGYEFVFRFNDQSGGFLPDFVIAESEYLSWWDHLFTDNTADFDNDGDMDVLYRTVENDVYFFENIGNNEFQDSGILSQGIHYYTRGAFIIQDMNEDGWLDFVRPMQDIYVEIQKGDQRMVAWSIYSPGVNRDTAELTSFDYDHDGDEDIISSLMDGIGVYENLGNNQNSAVQFLANYQAHNFLGMDDYNNDGFDDMVSFIQENQYTYITINYSIGNGEFDLAQNPIDQDITLINPYLADIDQDGKKDLVLVSNLAPVTVTWYSFSEAGYSGPFTLGTWNNSGTIGQSSAAKSFREGDYNGDGHVDYCVAALNEIRVLLGDGTGNYSILDPLPSNSLHVRLNDGDAGDFNQDGIDDIAYVTNNSSNGTVAMGILTFDGIGFVNHPVALNNAPSLIFFGDLFHTDFDQDGDEDIIWYYSESAHILLNSGDASFTEAYTTTFGFIDVEIRSIEVVNLNNDFLPDLIVGIANPAGTGDQVFYKMINALDSPYQVRCHVFYDTDGNGVQDPGEVGIHEREIAFSSPYGYHYTNSNGMFTLYCQEGSIEAAISENALIWNPSTPWSQTVIIDASNPVADIYFGMQPNGAQPIVESAITVVSGPCDAIGNHVLTITNTGNTIASGYIEYTFDSLCTFVEASINPEILGTTNHILKWYFNDLYYGESFTVELSLIAPDYTHIGEMMYHELNATITDANGDVVFTNMVVYDEEVTCAYDPNSLDELQGHTDSGYVLAGDDLEFEIQFQNLGNAPATNVRIEDQLSSQLDWTSLQPIAVSHPYEIMIDETGYLTFTFNGINLPAAASDELNSHGFARFRIRTKENLVAWEVIENTASIYFDFNPPVHTNTTMNTIYDCADLLQGVINTDTLCTGDDLVGSNGAIWMDELVWNYGGEEVSVGNLTYEPNASGNLIMHASNELCEAELSWPIFVDQPVSEFTQEINILTATPAIDYQWYLDGDLIDGATNATYHISTTGNYSVMITDEMGCSAISEEIQVLYTDVAEEMNIQFQFSPNPVTTQLTIRTGNSHFSSFSILDMQGKVVMKLAMFSDKTKTFDVGALPNGSYVLQSSDQTISKSFMIVH